MKVKGRVALETGVSRPKGIGWALVNSLLDQGAEKIYVGGRNIKKVTPLMSKNQQCIVPLLMDIVRLD